MPDFRHHAYAGFLRWVPAVVLLYCTAVTGTLVGQEVDARRLSELFAELESEDVHQRRDAAYALAAMQFDSSVHNAAELVPALLAALDDKDEQVWTQTMRTLAKLGPEAAPAIEKLLPFLGHWSGQRRYRTAFVLGRIGVPAIEPLRQTLRDPRSKWHDGAAQALGWIGPEAADAVADLVLLLNEAGDETRRHAATALAKMGPIAERALVQQLDGDHSAIRQLVLEALAEMGSQSSQAQQRLQYLLASDVAQERALVVRVLTHVAEPETRQQVIGRALQDAEHQVRDAGIAAFLRSGNDFGVSMLPTLQQLLRADAPEVQDAAAFLIGSLGNRGAPAIADLLNVWQQSAAVGSRSSDVPGSDARRTSIPSALSRIGPVAIESILQAAQAGTVSVAQAADAIRSIGGRATPILLEKTHSDSAVVRQAIALGLGGIFPVESQVVDAVGEMLLDPDAGVRVAAAQGLGRMGGAAKDLQDQLLLVSQDSQADVRVAALQGLIRVGADRDRLLQRLPTAMEDSAVEVRRAALEAVSHLGDQAAPLSEPLLAALSDSEPQVRAGAATAVAAIGVNPEQAIPALMRVLQDRAVATVASAAEALGQYGQQAESAVAALVELLEHVEPAVVVAAVEALGNIGDRAASALEVLSAKNQHSDVLVRKAVLSSLQKLAPEEPRAIETVIQGLADPQWEVRHVAAEVLARYGSLAQAAVPWLFRMLDDDRDRDVARQALREIDTVDAAALPVLLDALESQDQTVQYYGVFFVGKLGNDAKEALPLLKRLSKTENRRSRDAVNKAIAAIEAEQ